MSVERFPVAVVGAGPAGLEAAATAAEQGLKVLLVDAYGRPGGQYFKQLPAAFRSAERSRHQREFEGLARRLEHPLIGYLPDTVVWGVFSAEEDGGWELALYGARAPARVGVDRLILAAGAYDRPVLFPGWTLPGVMTAGAVQGLIKSQRVLPGNRFLLSGSGPLQLAAAALIVQAGGEVVAVLEGAHVGWRSLRHLPAAWGQWAKFAEGWEYARALRSARVPVRDGWSVIGAEGKDHVEAATIARLDSDWRPIPGTEQQVEADTIVTGYGFVPATELSRVAGCEHVIRPERGGCVPVRDDEMQTTRAGIYAVGDGAGIAGAGAAQLEGRIATLAAARSLSGAASLEEELAQVRKRLAGEHRFANMLAAMFTPGSGIDTLITDDTIVCRCEEVTWGQIKAAVSDGARTVGEVKGLTYVGMGYCQGRICGSLVPRLVSRQLSRMSYPVPAHADMLTARPPIHPVPLAVLAAQASDQTVDSPKATGAV